MALFTGASIAYLWIVFSKKLVPGITALIVAGVFLRILTLPGNPTHSDDHERFFWDGAVTAYDPSLTYAYTPAELDLERHPVAGLDAERLSRLNSPVYYSLYPPVCQSIWAACYTLGGREHEGFLWMLKGLAILAEIVTIIMVARLLRLAGMDVRLLAIYALNPLVVIELSGNLHPEVFMICGLSVASYYGYHWVRSGYRPSSMAAVFAMSVAVDTKLIPLIFLPLVIRYAGWKKGLIFSAAVGMVSLLLFVPFLSATLWQNLANSIDLYFRQFEFNASVYYLVRELGMRITGYNEIDLIGPALSLATLLTCLFIYFRNPGQQKKPADLALAVFSVYLLFSTTVHPWYLAILAFISVFASRTYGIIWTIVVFLSYSHYEGDIYREQYVWIGIEYTALLFWLIAEHRVKKRHPSTEATT